MTTGIIETSARKILSGQDRSGNEAAIGMDIMEMFNEMPMFSVLMFQQNMLTAPAEEVVAGLLAQVHKVK